LVFSNKVHGCQKLVRHTDDGTLEYVHSCEIRPHIRSKIAWRKKPKKILPKNCVIFTKEARLPKAAPANASNPSIVRSEKTTIITPMHEFSPGELTVQEAPLKCQSKILKKGIQEFFAKPFSCLSVCLFSEQKIRNQRVRERKKERGWGEENTYWEVADDEAIRTSANFPQKLPCICDLQSLNPRN
jgi:hypothetical protein